jgi:hypothetical protein
VSTRVDLHAHTTASDGLLTPAALLERAVEAGLATIAMTDHDTAAGVREVQGLPGGVPGGLEVIPGIEVSAYVGDRDLHVLGFFIDPRAAALLEYEEERRVQRTERLKQIVAGLQAGGLAITLDEVYAQPGGDSAPGRPHVARVLIAKGYGSTMGDVFKRLLGKGGPGYVPYPKPEAGEAVTLIKAAGGLAVIAHPGLDDLDGHLDALVDKGMAGIEVFHPEHDAAARARYHAFADRRGIAVSGGSDFHGDGKKDGGALGGTPLEPSYLLALRRAAGRA